MQTRPRIQFFNRVFLNSCVMPGPQGEHGVLLVSSDCVVDHYHHHGDEETRSACGDWRAESASDTEGVLRRARARLTFSSRLSELYLRYRAVFLRTCCFQLISLW